MVAKPESISFSAGRRTKGVVPRTDEAAIIAMNEREVKRSVKEDLTTREIISLLESTSMDWRSLEAAVMPGVVKAIIKDGKIAARKNRERSNLKDFSKLLIDEVE